MRRDLWSRICQQGEMSLLGCIWRNDTTDLIGCCSLVEINQTKFSFKIYLFEILLVNSCQFFKIIKSIGVYHSPEQCLIN